VAHERDRALTLIALERAFRAIVLVAAGAVLLTHTHTDWAAKATDVARALGLDPSSGGIHRILVKLKLLGPSKIRAYGAIGIAYGALEGVESYGLFTDRSWAEYLTVLATAVLLLPEGWEIAKSPTALKIGGTLVNVLVVAFLVRRLRVRRTATAPR
jgi:uncharacterized membrane protein (DUF2068 family)